MGPKGAVHLVWIPGAAAAGFFASFVFADLLRIPKDVYLLIYFTIALVFLWSYVRTSGLDLAFWASRRFLLGVILGGGVGVAMIFNVIARPKTPRFPGALLAWEVFWRGLMYGAVDGLLLYTFPWLVTWRAFAVAQKTFWNRIAFGVFAWVFVMVVTTGYHLGYPDFRSGKIVQADIGGTIMSLPTIVSGNALSAPFSHMILHVTAVVHSPETELFLPPHEPGGEQQPGGQGESQD